MPQIRTSPAVEWPAGQQQLVTVAVTTLPAGRTLDDWDGFTLTVREDPDFPRTTAELGENLDPAGDGWAVAVTADGTADADEDTVTFGLTVPAAPGPRRYALDVWGTGGTAGAVQLVPATWVTVLPSVRSLA